MLAKYTRYIVGFVAVFALVHACTYMMIHYSSPSFFLWPISFLAFIATYVGGNFQWALVGDLFTTLILFAFLSLVVKRVWRMKGEQELTWLLGLKMLGVFLLYMAIVPIFFLILFYS